jgi:hypothetical protein
LTETMVLSGIGLSQEEIYPLPFRYKQYPFTADFMFETRVGLELE